MPARPTGPGQVPHGDAAVDQIAGRHALVCVVGHDAAERHLERRPQGGVDLGARLLDLPHRHPQAVGHVDPVELGRGPDDGGVAVGAHLPEDRRHHVVDVGTRSRGPRQDVVEGRRRAAEVQDTEGHEATRLPA